MRRKIFKAGVITLTMTALILGGCGNAREQNEEISSYTDGNNYVAICLDGEVQSSPQVSEKITSNSQRLS